jgi:hypothetical protein
MMHALSCACVRERLEAFHDAELTLDEQVAIQTHLGECVACALAAAELEDMSGALREGAAGDGTPDEALEITRNVMERLRVEEQFALRARIQDLFADMHLVWAGLGATLATLVCVAGSASVLHAASQERPDSLAGLISVLANPGSNENPVRLDAEMTLPRRQSDLVVDMSGQDAAFALSAVVTREGKIQNLQILAAEYGDRLRVKPEVVIAMLNEASRARFEPAQARAPVCRFNAEDCGGPVAVNLVWLLTSTTVKGSEDMGALMLRKALSVRPSADAPGPLPAPPVRSPVPKPSSDDTEAAVGL